MDDFDWYTTSKHPGNPVPIDTEKRDLHLRIKSLESEVAALRQQVEGMRGALGQARFCINELVPTGKDRDFTLKIINAAIDARKESRNG